MALDTVQVIRDENDWYVIPNEVYKEFFRLSVQIISCKKHSEEWYNSIEEFKEKFGTDFDMTQLYANI